jgi:hypothetical protein
LAAGCTSRPNPGAISRAWLVEEVGSSPPGLRRRELPRRAGQGCWRSRLSTAGNSR